MQLVETCTRLQKLTLVDCSPITNEHCELITRRYAAAGRWGLEVYHNSQAPAHDAHGDGPHGFEVVF